MTSSKHSRIGKQKTINGKVLQQFISAQASLTKGKAYIRERSNPFSAIRMMENGHFECFRTASESVDFEGTLQGGRAVYFDCKSSSKDAFVFSNVNPNQVHYLSSHASLGAICFIYARQNYTKSSGLPSFRDFILPVLGNGTIGGMWHKNAPIIFKPHEEKIRESVAFNLLEKYSVHRLESWLDAVLRLHEENLWA